MGWGDQQHVIQIQNLQMFIVVSRKPGLDVLQHSLSSGARVACLDQQSYFLCLLLARRFETASCHKCALSLLASALIEISLATCLELLHVSRLWKLGTVVFGGLFRIRDFSQYVSLAMHKTSREAPPCCV